MSVDFLQELPIEPELRRRLLDLGAESPEALLEMIKSSRASFASAFGESTTWLLESRLPDMAASLEGPDSASTYKLGAHLGAPPRPQMAKKDTDQRDALFRELQQLRAKGELSESEQRRAEQLEKEIEDRY